MFKKIMIFLAVLIVILVTASVIYLNKVFIPKQLKPLVIEKLEQLLDKQVKIEDAFYFPLKGVLFSGVDIVNRDGTPFLQAQSVELRLKSLPKLRGREVVLNAKLLIEDLLFRQKDVELKGNCVVDGDLHYQNSNLGFTAGIFLDDIQLLGLPALADVTNIKGKITCTDKSFSGDIKAKAAGKLLQTGFSGTYDKKQAELENLDLSCGDSRLSFNGRIDDMIAQQIKGHVEGVLKLKDIKDLLAKLPLPELAGDCNVNGDVQGEMRDLTLLSARLMLQIEKGSVDKIKFSDAKAEISLDKGTVLIAPLFVGFYNGKIDGVFKSVIANNTIPCEGHINVEKVDIQPLILDLFGLDLGEGMVNAYLETQFEATDINSALGSGWIKLLNARLRPPPRFERVANSLKVIDLASMEIEQAGADFKIHDQKIETDDFAAFAKEATVTGKGYLGFDLKTEFECVFKLSKEFVQDKGGMNNLSAFISDDSGLPVAKVKVWGVLKPNGLKYESIPFAVDELFKTGVKQELKEGLQNVLKKGLKGLFK